MFDKNPAAFNEKFEVFKQARNSLIDTLARDFKVAHFIKQLFDPLKMNNNFHATGFGYKAKKFRDGTLRVSGHIPTDSAIQKESRLSDMERERLQLAFAREYNIQDFLNDTHRQDFFTRLSDAVRNHFEFLHTYKTDVNKFLYTENRILPTDKITQAKQKLQKEREAFKEFLHEMQDFSNKSLQNTESKQELDLKAKKQSLLTFSMKNISLSHKQHKSLTDYKHINSFNSVIEKRVIKAIIAKERNPPKANAKSGAKNTTQPSPTQVFFVKVKYCVTII